MTRHVLHHLKHFHWERLIALLLVAFGCNLCDPSGREQNGPLNLYLCDQYGLVSAMGFPYGPVTVTWSEVPVYGYEVKIWNKFGTLGDKGAASSQASVVVALDKSRVDQTLADDGLVTITGYATMSKPPSSVDLCQFDKTISIKAKKMVTPLPAPAVTCQKVRADLPCNCNGVCDSEESYYTCPQDCPFAPIPEPGQQPQQPAATCAQAGASCSPGASNCCPGLTCTYTSPGHTCR